MDGATALLGALLGGIAANVSAYALLVKNRGEASREKHRLEYLLARLWDWVQVNGHDESVPPNLADEIRNRLEGDSTP